MKKANRAIIASVLILAVITSITGCGCKERVSKWGFCEASVRG